MIAVTFTDVHNSGTKDTTTRLPHAVMAAARVLFGRDEFKLARPEVREELHLRYSSEDMQDARGRAQDRVARFITAVETGADLWDHDPVLKLINDRRVLRGNLDWATAMALLIGTWQKRRRREQQVAKELRALNPPHWSKPRY